MKYGAKIQDIELHSQNISPTIILVAQVSVSGIMAGYESCIRISAEYGEKMAMK